MARALRREDGGKRRLGREDTREEKKLREGKASNGETPGTGRAGIELTWSSCVSPGVRLKTRTTVYVFEGGGELFGLSEKLLTPEGSDSPPEFPSSPSSSLSLASGRP